MFHPDYILCPASLEVFMYGGLPLHLSNCNLKQILFLFFLTVCRVFLLSLERNMQFFFLELEPGCELGGKQWW